MERARDGRILVIADTCIPLNFMRADQMHLLGRRQVYKAIRIPQELR